MVTMTRAVARSMSDRQLRDLVASLEMCVACVPDVGIPGDFRSALIRSRGVAMEELADRGIPHEDDPFGRCGIDSI